MTGQTFGPYRVLDKLGEGGMGEVYRARDTKLERDVALKVIQDGFAGDRERQARFQREAQLLASLNHPHIGAIYGLEESDGITALVLELVEGPTLAERIAEGAMPLEEALPIARQIAEALEAAHDQGIVHRDLKPANVKLRSDGTVKVLDFGLAKALETAPAGTSSLSMSPTLTSPAHTQLGVIIGTAAYMAPEQARGRATDKRSDLWAYGCVLFEMLTGRRAFEGQDVTDTLAAIVRGEPDWSSLPAGTPQSIRRLLQRCLAKDPKLRLREAGSAILEIDEARTPLQQPAATARRRKPVLLFAAAAAVAVVLGTGYVAWPRPSSAPLLRLTMPVSPASTLRAATSTGSIVAISDDGRQVAFLGVAPGGAQLFVRGLDQSVATGLPGTIGATAPAFSPDGRWLSYAVGSTLFRIEVSGGAPQAVTTLSSGFIGGTWIDNDWLAFATRQTAGLMRVRAVGGEPERITSTDVAAGQFAHAYPSVVPGGRFLVYTAATPASGSQGGLRGDVWVVPVEGGTPRKLMGNAISALVTASGHLVFWRDGSLMAVPIDLSSMQLTGVPVTAQGGVEAVAPNWAVAANGTLAFVAAEDAGQASSGLMWLQDGRAITAIDITRAFADPRLSPEGRRVAVEITAEGDDIWVVDLMRGTTSRLTFETGEDETPAWSPDGEWIAYASDRSGQGRMIFRKRADGSGAEEKLWETDEHTHVDAWTPDGRALIVTRTDPKNANDLWFVPIGKPDAARPLLRGTFNELNGRVSPDGKWLAYTSNESGSEQIYVQPFPDMGAKWQVSARGGNQPVWAANGRTLFYRGEAALMAVDVESTARAFSATVPRRVGDDAYHRKGATHTGWDVGRDGRILVVRSGGTGGRPTQIQIVSNWLADLTRRAQPDR